MEETEEGKKNQDLFLPVITNTGTLGTLNGKYFRKHWKNCHGNFPAIILYPTSFTGIIVRKIKESGHNLVFFFILYLFIQLPLLTIKMKLPTPRSEFP